MAGTAYIVEVGGREVRISSPDKVVFPEVGLTKRDLVDFVLAVGEGSLRAVRDRPTVLLRFPNGAGAEGFYQKRLPKGAPDWVGTVRIRFPSGRVADELRPTELAHVLWALNLGSFGLHPWPVRAGDVEHPDLVRIDLDPQPGVGFAEVCAVAGVVRAVLDEVGLVGFPKTSGSRGIHILVPVVADRGFVEVRRCVLALAREVERRVPHLATANWWKADRGERVFVDYNQAARDRTIAATYAVRPTPSATVSTPVTWDEIAVGLDPLAFTVRTVPARFAELGDLHAAIDDEVSVRSLDALAALADRDEAEGLGDAPWPPHFPKRESEPLRAPTRQAASRADALVVAGVTDASLLDPDAGGDVAADGRRGAVLFDLDGTLASSAWRVPLVEGRPKAWDRFFAGIPFDRPNPEVAEFWRSVPDGWDRLVLTGRPEHTRADTMRWLAEHGFGAPPVFMRTDGDRRADHVVKRELFESLIEPHWDVRTAVEDLAHVAAVWDSLRLNVRFVTDPALEPLDGGSALLASGSDLSDSEHEHDPDPDPSGGDSSR